MTTTKIRRTFIKNFHPKTWAVNKWILPCFFYVLTSGVCAKTQSLNDAKTQMSAINQKISILESKLSKATDKQLLLHEEIKNTEKQIGQNVNELHKVRIKLNKQQLSLDALENEINTLSDKLAKHQTILKKQILVKYQMGEYQPLKWLLGQDNPSEISQLMTYYQYLIKSQTKAIRNIKVVQDDLDDVQNKKTAALNVQRQLEQDVINKQIQLKNDQVYRAKLLKKIKEKINSSQQELAQFHKDKQSLAKLIEKLSRHSHVQSQKPFSRMKHKLPLPVDVKRNSIHELNQGLVFFSKEGSPVESVYPGKIVFSDWLKGYGLLIIVDHGSGYLTLYAHNQSLFKQKGDAVDWGEQIATVGHSGGIKQNGLYFEIRHRGKAISPQNWLS